MSAVAVTSSLRDEVRPQAFVFDPNRCTGCQACAIACGIENYPDRFGAGPANWRQIQTFNEMHLPGLPTVSLSLACNHCEDPACMRACPANAYTKDPSTGAVLVVADRCIGCKYCTWACPYDAPRFDHAAGVIEKCTFCNHRLTDGAQPACVVACPTAALGIEDRGRDAGLDGGWIGFAPTDLEPAIRFVPWRGGAVRTDAGVPTGTEAAALPRSRSKITLASEWSLFAFTSVVIALVSAFAALQLAPAGAVRFGARFPPAFALTGAAALLLSTWHLARKERAWRAVLNGRTSWLSREVLLVSSFLVLASAWSLVVSGAAIRSGAWPRTGWPVAAGLLIALLGFAATQAVDRVYSVIVPPGRDRPGGRRHHFLHPGPALTASLYLAGLPTGNIVLWLPAAVLKMAVYAALRADRAGTRSPATLARAALPRPAMASVLRVGLGFLAPLGLLAWSDAPTAAFALGLAGEFIERAQFYDGLAVTTPRLEMEMGLRARLAAAE